MCLQNQQLTGMQALVRGMIPVHELQECIHRARRYESLHETQRRALCAHIEELVDLRPFTPKIKSMLPCLERLPNHVVIGIDFETNGIHPPNRYQILEIGAMNYDSGRLFHSLVNPGEDVIGSKKAYEVHGISLETVVNRHVWKWERVWDSFLEWLKNEADGRKIVLAAHNGIPYDFEILLEKCGKNDIDPNWSFLDTYVLAKDLKSKGLLNGRAKLEDLAKELDVENQGQRVLQISFEIRSCLGTYHHADTDIQNLGFVLKEMLKLDGHSPKYIAEIVEHGGNEWCLGYSAFVKRKEPQIYASIASITQKAPQKRKIVNKGHLLKEQVQEVMEMPCTLSFP